MTKNDIKDLNKLAELHKIRTTRTNDIDELKFLALMEKGVYVLKTALIEACTLNRTAWMTEVLRLKKEIADCLQKNESLNDEVYTLLQVSHKIGTENIRLRKENERLTEQLAQLTNEITNNDSNGKTESHRGIEKQGNSTDNSCANSY